MVPTEGKGPIEAVWEYYFGEGAGIDKTGARSLQVG